MRDSSRPNPTLPVPFLAFLLAGGLILLPACSGGHDAGHQEAAAAGEAHAEAGTSQDEAGDPAAEIAQWQARRDDAGRNDALSPFTAIQAHYVDEGVTARIGAAGDAVARDPGEAMKQMAAVTYRDEAFWVGPVAGSDPPRIHGRDDNGEPLAEGSPVEKERKLEGGELVGIGRYFLSLSPQSGFGRILIYDPQAPMKKEFHGFKWYPPAPQMRVMATWVPAPDPMEVTVATSRGLEKTFYRAGHLEFDVDGTPQTLIALSDRPVPDPGDVLFVPFRDATTGKETYEVGRYLDVTYNGPGKKMLIDFNTATNPSCNYSVHYNCPIPPKENRLTVAIRAGEMTYPVHGS